MEYSGCQGAGPWDDSAAGESADFKVRVAQEAIREQHTINELASEYGVYPNLIREWKKLLLSESPQVFNSRRGDEQKLLEEERDRLFQPIGQLQLVPNRSFSGQRCVVAARPMAAVPDYSLDQTASTRGEENSCG
ncbi:MAG: transposase [Ktedonobacterales bacterium]